MVNSCCYCGIPLQRATQYVAIADIILGILNFSLLAVQLAHFNESYGKLEVSFDDSSSYTEHDHYRSSMSYRYSATTRRPRMAFISILDKLPYGLIMTVVVCHGIQLVMGVVLYVAAVNKHRSTLIFWMIITAFTALFTGIIWRLYEMVIVNEFCREVKQEQEVTYFHDQIQSHAHPVPVPQPQPQPVYPNYCNRPDTLVPPIEPNTNLISMISGHGRGGYNYSGFGPTTNQYGYPGGYSGNYGGFQNPTLNTNTNTNAQQQMQFQYDAQNIPAALQPPPQYEEAMKQAPYYFNVSSASGGDGNTSTDAGRAGFSNPGLPGPSTQQVPRGNAPSTMQLFPEKGNDFSTSFTKF